VSQPAPYQQTFASKLGRNSKIRDKHRDKEERPAMTTFYYTLDKIHGSAFFPEKY
jgi:hypothetical protein